MRRPLKYIYTDIVALDAVEEYERLGRPKA